MEGYVAPVHLGHGAPRSLAELPIDCGADHLRGCLHRWAAPGHAAGERAMPSWRSWSEAAEGW